MIDFYRKSILSQFGKDAGNQSIPEYARNVISNYDKNLSKAKEQKLKPIANRNEDLGLYL